MRIPAIKQWLSVPQNMFLLLALLSGTLFVAITPPAIVGDEPNHLFRAFQVSDGIVVGQQYGILSGGWIPKNLFVASRNLVGNIEFHPEVKFDRSLIGVYGRTALNEDDRMFVGFPNTVVYSPVPYLPQAVGIVMVRAANGSPLAAIYAARSMNLICFIALGYFSIFFTPLHKWVMCSLLLLPTTMFQAASASADAFTIGICFLTVGYVLSLALDERAIRGPQIAAIFAVCVLAVLSKQAYVLLPLIALIIPCRKFPGRAACYLIKTGVIVAGFFVAGSWSRLIAHLIAPYRGDVFIDPGQQFAGILNDPLRFVGLALSHYFTHAGGLVVSFFGQLTFNDLALPLWLPIGLAIVMTALAFADRQAGANVPFSAKLLAMAVFGGTAVLVAFSLYLMWSPVGADAIEGIQGRYFIPIAPLLLLAFYNRRPALERLSRYLPAAVAILTVVSLTITLYCVIDRYYG